MLNKFVICLSCTLWFNYCSAAIYAIEFDSQFYYKEYEDAEALFGPKLAEGAAVRGMLVYADPENGCQGLKPPPNSTDNQTEKWIVLVPRSNVVKNCTFEEKVRLAQAVGYDAVIVHNINSDQLVPMSAKNDTGIRIPSVFVSQTSGDDLRTYTDSKYFIVITGESPFNIQTHLLIPFAIVLGICFIVMIVFMIVKFVKDRRRQRRHRLPTSTLNKIPTCKFQKGDPYETCAICLDDYVEEEKLRVLPCNHVYHTKCIDPWLTKNRRVCPICKRKVFAHDEPHHDSETDSDTDNDTSPLINPANRGTQGGTFDEQTENPLQRAARSISQQSGAANLVTASDHHSIGGDFESSYNSAVSTTTSDEESLHGETAGNCDNLDEVHVHTQPPSEDQKSDIHV